MDRDTLGPARHAYTWPVWPVWLIWPVWPVWPSAAPAPPGRAVVRVRQARVAHSYRCSGRPASP
ncbi:hypothetical protein DN402_09580 [Streptomyces sp. SW4]|nr:hypothetical protein DN402_09580 [Streptomyces sp. SW4]